MKPVITSLAILLISISINISICDARILNVPEDYQTIQAGIDSTHEGDTVLVQRGEYHEGTHVNNRSIVLTSAYIYDHSEETIAATIIDGDNRQIGSSLVWFGEGKQATVIGFTITNCHPMGLYVLESNVTVSHCRFINNEGDHDPGGAIFATGDSIEIENCAFLENFSPVWGGAVGVGSSFATIRSCLFAGNIAGREGGALVVFNRCEVVNCTFVDNRTRGSGSGIMVANRSQARISNSIFTDNHPYFLATGGFNAGGSSIWIDWCNAEGGVDSVQVNGNDSVHWSGDTLHWGENNIDADPIFLDPDNSDYHLTANSPCIDAGDPEAALDPDGTRADMGVFYFHQKDIEVYPDELTFGALPFGSVDSQLVVVANIGGTPLTFRISASQENSCITIPEAGGAEIVVEPESGRQLWAYYRPAEGAALNQTFTISSDDPDEPEITIQATGDVNAVPSDNLRSAFFTLHSAFPNPFNSSTTIRFSVGLEAQPTRLAVYGIDGRLVKELWTGGDAYPTEERQAGARPMNQAEQVVWNAEGLPGGVYLIRLESGSDVRTMKAILLR